MLLPQGTSPLPVLYDEANALRPPDHLFGWELFGHRGIGRGEWKLVWAQALPAVERRWLLFNLDDDPSEQNDLSASRPAKLSEMVDAWELYEEENGVIY